jgi:aromatic ring hydroxylase
MVIHIRFARSYKALVQSSFARITRVEAGSNTSTVTLRVARGDEEGSLKSVTVKYGRESQGTRTQERLRWPGQQHIQKTDPSSCQRGRPTKTRP